AANVAEIARGRGVQTIASFFNSALAAEIRRDYGAAKAIVANNVLAHVDDPIDLLRGVAQLLSDDGAIAFEAPYLVDLIDGLEYDTIYHEHLSYFSVRDVIHMADRASLCIQRVERLPVHGGSLRVTATRSPGGATHCATARAMAIAEQERGM